MCNLQKLELKDLKIFFTLPLGIFVFISFISIIAHFAGFGIFKYIFFAIFILFATYSVGLYFFIPFYLGLQFFKNTKSFNNSNVVSYIIYQILTVLPLLIFISGLIFIIQTELNLINIVIWWIILLLFTIIRILYQGNYLTKKLLFLEKKQISKKEFLKVGYKLTHFYLYYYELYPRIKIALK